MKIYTKTGDGGSTSLIGGDRAEKCDLRVWAYGSIDEANSSIGIARTYIKEEELLKNILNIQKSLFEVGAELASVGTKHYKQRIVENDIKNLETIIDRLDTKKPLQNGFIVPGGTVESAHLDVARTDVRRAERYIIELKNSYEINKYLIKYINRLSDAIYAIARYFDYKFIIEKCEEKINENSRMNLKPLLQGINRKLAEYITKKCIEKAYEIQVPMVVCITDFGGNIILLERMDDAILISLEVAMKKAYTAVALKQQTRDVHRLALPNGAFYGINNLDKIIALGGGIPLKIENQVVGAIGISGGSVEQDIEVAEYGAKAFEEGILNGIK